MIHFLLPTLFGDIHLVADHQALYSLSFSDLSSTPLIQPAKMSPPVTQVIDELQAYASGHLKVFKTPMFLKGTPFQRRVWGALKTIPYGETRSYKEIAIMIGKPTACRAVALANRSNPLAILIPCHRVIRSDGDLCGYNGGVAKKAWLLCHEKRYASSLTAL